jgi:hypothetical protein
MSDTPEFKFSLLQGLIEIVSNRELPAPIVYGLAIILLAIAIKIVLWRPGAPK